MKASTDYTDSVLGECAINRYKRPRISCGAAVSQAFSSDGNTEMQVNLSNRYELTDKIAAVLESLRKKGVKLWMENSQLRYKAPRGVLTQEDIESLKLYRDQIAALLKQFTDAENAEPKLERRSRLDRAPLAFSQLAHWNFYRLSERPAIRQIASATRLQGQLNVNALQKSIAEVVRRHDALRTRIVVIDGVPMQEVAESGGCELEVSDLTGLPEALLETEVKRLIESYILQPIDVAVDPLFGVRLLKLRDDEHVLIMTMEHIISDMFSMNILMRETFEAYMQALKARDFSLPEIPVQFADYAVCQRNTLASWMEKHGTHWNERLAGCQPLRFPGGKSSPPAINLGWGILPVRIGMELKKELSEWSRLRRTTLVMSVFTAYVALVLRWCNASESIIRYQSDGRVSSEIQNTIGYFASALYIRTGLLEGDRFIDLLNHVIDQYCKAYEHTDFSYFSAQVSPPEITRSSGFNWLPQRSKFDSVGSEDAITCSPVNFVHPMGKNLEVDGEPSIGLLETEEGGIAGEVWFPLNRFSVETMERFGRNFLVFIQALLRQPEGRVRDILLVK
jgi:hypothetical protein